jgi:catechol 2,3-dioxygenase-like lactoylglutathione lyase family enzyme
MTEFQKIVPVLLVADLERAVEFYTTVLGFSVAWRSANDGGGENAMLLGGKASVLLSTGEHLGATPHFTGTLYFSMTGVREFFDRIREKVEVVWPLETMDYGQTEFGIRDVDGYTLAFAETAEEES